MSLWMKSKRYGLMQSYPAPGRVQDQTEKNLGTRVPDDLPRIKEEYVVDMIVEQINEQYPGWRLVPGTVTTMSPGEYAFRVKPHDGSERMADMIDGVITVVSS